jgi:hypothetical protein
VRVEGNFFHGRVPEGSVYVGRAAPGLKASPFGNPYPVKRHGLDESRRLYRELLGDMAEHVQENLAGCDLACWCPLDAPWCHADDLLLIANLHYRPERWATR